MNEDMILELGDDDDIDLELGDDGDMELNDGLPYYNMTTDYWDLKNKPQINGVTLIGNKTSEELNIIQTVPLTNLQIEELFNQAFN